MIVNRSEILERVCYTELVYDRIKKKLNFDISRKEMEDYIIEILKNTNADFFTKTGKNYYVMNTKVSIRSTINSNTFRVITVDKIK